MKSPKVSVVIPVHNGQNTLEKTLSSVFQNSYRNFEVIVVDDGSTDSSAKIAKKFPCRIIKLDKVHGGGYARNKGAESAKGELLLFVDSDIVIPKNCMKYGVEYLSKHKNVTALLGLFSTNLVYNNFFSNYKHLYLRYYFLSQNKVTHTLNTSLTFIRKNVFDKFRGFDTKIKSVISEDAELGMRLTENGYVIHQSRELEMEHLKYYSFADFLRTEFVRSRKIFLAFASKLLSRKKKNQKSFFFFKPANVYLSIPIAYLMAFSFFLSAISPFFLLTGVLLLAFFIFVNFDFWKFLKKERNFLFSIKASFATLLSMLWMGIGIAFGFFDFLTKNEKQENVKNHPSVECE